MKAATIKYDGAISLVYSPVNSGWLGMWHDQVLRIFTTKEEAVHWANQLMSSNVELGFEKDLEVEFNHWIEPDQEGPEGAFGYDTEEENREAIAEIYRQLRAGNDAAWCLAIVEAKVEIEGEVFTGKTHVGGVSYGSERELWKDMLEDLKLQAVDDLFTVMRKYGERATKAQVALDYLLEKYGG